MELALCVATMQEDPVPQLIHGWVQMSATTPAVYVQHNTKEKNFGVVDSYNRLYDLAKQDIICFLHDDVICREKDWDRRVLAEFERPDVAVVGFGGAAAHGSDDLYKIPYRLNDLARFGYRSNVDDAEAHGVRYEGACDVAVLDGFALCIRRSFLDRLDGFRCLVGHCDFFNYDYSVCALARRAGFRVRMVGIRCHHLGGRTSTGVQEKSITGQVAYDNAHRWFYEEFRDVMPFKVKDEQVTG